MRTIVNDGGPFVIIPFADLRIWGGKEIQGKYGLVLEDYELICCACENSLRHCELLTLSDRPVIIFGTEHIIEAAFCNNEDYLFAFGYIMGEMSENNRLELAKANTSWELLGKVPLKVPGIVLMHGAFSGQEVTMIDAQLQNSHTVDSYTMQYGLKYDLATGEYTCEYWLHVSESDEFVVLRFSRI